MSISLCLSHKITAKKLGKKHFEELILKIIFDDKSVKKRYYPFLDQVIKKAEERGCVLCFYREEFGGTINQVLGNGSSRMGIVDFFSKSGDDKMCMITEESGRPCEKVFINDIPTLVCHLREHGIRVMNSKGKIL